MRRNILRASCLIVAIILQCFTADDARVGVLRYLNEGPLFKRIFPPRINYADNAGQALRLIDRQLDLS